MVVCFLDEWPKLFPLSFLVSFCACGCGRTCLVVSHVGGGQVRCTCAQHRSITAQTLGRIVPHNCPPHFSEDTPKIRYILSIAAQGGGTQGAEPDSGGPEVFGGPLGASEFDPSFQQFGVSETPSQGPLHPPERLSEAPERLFRGLGKVCSFSTERGKQGGPLRGP